MNQPLITKWELIEEYGQRVNREQASGFFEQAVAIKSKWDAPIREFIEKFSDATASEKADAAAYYGNNSDAYVFSYEMVEALYAKMKGKPESYLVLFEGARPSTDSIPEHNGRRTVVGLVYHKLPSGNLKIDTDKIIGGKSEDIGIEHPGTKPPPDGSGGTSTITTIPDEIEKVIKML